MSTVLYLMRRFASYGQRVVSWIWANRYRILGWIRTGMPLSAIIALIKRILGLR